MLSQMVWARLGTWIHISYPLRNLQRNDTYSFGVMVFEVSGDSRMIDHDRPNEEIFLSAWAKRIS